jgi:hypothetical protein
LNDPDSQERAKETSFLAYQWLDDGIAKDFLAERYGAARLARLYLRPSSPWGGAAREAATLPAQPASFDMDQDEVAQQRWMTARLIMDFAHRLPPHVADNMAAGLLLLNLGLDAPIFRRYHIKGLKRGEGRHATRDAIVALHVYYLAGYRSHSLDEVLRAEAGRFAGLNLNVNILNKIVRKLGIQPTVDEARKLGREDKLNGRPEASPFGARRRQRLGFCAEPRADARADPDQRSRPDRRAAPLCPNRDGRCGAVVQVAALFEKRAR